MGNDRTRSHGLSGAAPIHKLSSLSNASRTLTVTLTLSIPSVLDKGGRPTARQWDEIFQIPNALLGQVSLDEGTFSCEAL